MSSNHPQTLLTEAAGVPSLLAAAYDVFEYILVTLRAAEAGATDTLLSAVVMAAAAAANGRDAVAAAPSLPPGPGRSFPAAQLPSTGAVADEMAALGQLLAGRLTAAPAAGADRSACTAAAAEAARIHLLLRGQVP